MLPDVGAATRLFVWLFVGAMGLGLLSAPWWMRAADPAWMHVGPVKPYLFAR